MSERLSITASAREKIGKNPNRRLRAAGIIPAVFYSPASDSLPIQVKEAELMKLYARAGRTAVVDLQIDNNGKKSTHPSLIWDVEYYPTQNRFQHVDFYGVDLQKELKIRVPLEFTGVAKGTKLGGKLETYREHIYILSKPEHLPQKIQVEISNLDVGEGLRVADLAMPEGVRASYDDNFAIINVTMPGAGKDSDEEENNAE